MWACVEANKLVRESGKSNIDKCRIPVVSNWNFEYLSKKLKNYHDQEVVDLLKFGFPIECKVQGSMQVPANHTGADQHPEQIRYYIKTELNKGTLIGPFHTNPWGKCSIFPYEHTP